MTVTKIDCPKEWESEDDWDSHRPLLWLAAKKQTGDIVEMGSGLGSTPLLDKECFISGRKFLSIESNDQFNIPYPIYGSVIRDDYLYVKERWHEMFDGFNIGILFVDCAPGELRKDLINKFKELSKVIIVHDSEKTSQFCYDLEPTLSKFKYRLDYEPKYKPHTTAVSNYVNFEEWI
jgi:hypothetical protein